MPLGAISGTVFQDDNNDGIQQLAEGGINGVVVTLTGTDVFGNAVNIQTTTDQTGRYLFEALNPGEYSVTQTQPEGFLDGIDTAANGAVVSANDVVSNISLGFGQAFESATFAEQPQTPGASGNPPQFPSLGPLNSVRLSNLLGSFAGSPGTIYSGIPVAGNNNPLSLDSGRPVTGGYDIGQGQQAVDVCGNVIPVEQIIDNGCGCGPVNPQGQIQFGDATIEGVEVVPTDTDSISEADGTVAEETEGDVVDQIDQQRSEETAGDDVTIGKPWFLKRMAKWLNV